MGDLELDCGGCGGDLQLDSGGCGGDLELDCCDGGGFLELDSGPCEEGQGASEEEAGDLHGPASADDDPEAKAGSMPAVASDSHGWKYVRCKCLGLLDDAGRLAEVVKDEPLCGKLPALNDKLAVQQLLQRFDRAYNTSHSVDKAMSQQQWLQDVNRLGRLPQGVVRRLRDLLETCSKRTCHWCGTGVSLFNISKWASKSTDDDVVCCALLFCRDGMREVESYDSAGRSCSSRQPSVSFMKTIVSRIESNRKWAAVHVERRLHQWCKSQWSRFVIEFSKDSEFPVVQDGRWFPLVKSMPTESWPAKISETDFEKGHVRLSSIKDVNGTYIWQWSKDGPPPPSMTNLKSDRRVVVNAELSREMPPIIEYRRGRRIETPVPRLVVAKKNVPGVVLPSAECPEDSKCVGVACDWYPPQYRKECPNEEHLNLDRKYSDAGQIQFPVSMELMRVTPGIKHVLTIPRVKSFLYAVWCGQFADQVHDDEPKKTPPKWAFLEDMIAALPVILKLSVEPRLCNERVRFRGFYEAFATGRFDSSLRSDECLGSKLLDRAEEVAPACDYVSQKLAHVQPDWPRSRRFLRQLADGEHDHELRVDVEQVLRREQRLRLQASRFLSQLHGELLPEERSAESVQQLVQGCMRGELDRLLDTAGPDKDWSREDVVRACLAPLVSIRRPDEAATAQRGAVAETGSPSQGLGPEMASTERPEEALATERLRLEHERSMIVAEARAELQKKADEREEGLRKQHAQQVGDLERQCSELRSAMESMRKGREENEAEVASKVQALESERSKLRRALEEERGKRTQAESDLAWLRGEGLEQSDLPARKRLRSELEDAQERVAKSIRHSLRELEESSPLRA